jgi:hypothetical protein
MQTQSLACAVATEVACAPGGSASAFPAHCHVTSASFKDLTKISARVSNLALIVGDTVKGEGWWWWRALVSETNDGPALKVLRLSGSLELREVAR